MCTSKALLVLLKTKAIIGNQLYLLASRASREARFVLKKPVVACRQTWGRRLMIQKRLPNNPNRHAYPDQ